MSNITLNIVEPGGPTPDPVVPNTGLFTHGIGGPEATIITVSTILVLALVVAIVWYYKKHTNIRITNITKHIKAKKSIAIGLTVLAILVSAGTFASLLINAGKSNTNAAEGEDNNSLTVDVSSEELTIEVGNEPVFAVLPVEVSVEQATQAGYTLTAYTDNTDLVSTTDPSNIIPMVTLPEPLAPNEEGVGRGWGPVTKLTDNTYGLALVEPESEEDELYMPLSISSDNPTIIKSMTEYTPTAENDTTTIYYGFYITPDIPYGTYTNDGEVHYNATINTTPVTFDGKGLYFNDDEQQTTNTVEYIAVSQENNETETSSTINQPISGEYKTPSQSLPYRFLGWSTDPESTEPTYTSEDDIAEYLPISPNIPLTLYAVWQKATTITYDNNGGVGEMNKQTIIAGESANLYPNTFTKDGYTFTGWNTVATPTEQTPGKSYTDKELYQAEAESANVTLFAKWKKNILYMQKVSEWGSSLEIGDEVIAVDNRDDKEYYVARLADNNIWMTQNLDLDLNENVTFTPEDTDISQNWKPVRSTISFTDTTVTGWQNDNNTPYSADPDDVYYYPLSSDANDKKYDSLEDCERDHSDGTCQHYHAGNYYNWSAAVASNDTSGITAEFVNISGSICPAGWKLPTGIQNNSSDWLSGNEQGTLLNDYGILGGKDCGGSCYTYAEGGFEAIRTAPLWLTRAGRIGRSSEQSLSDNDYGFYLSNTVKGSDRAGYINFGNSYVYGAGFSSHRGHGISIRCMTE